MKFPKKKLSNKYENYLSNLNINRTYLIWILFIYLIFFLSNQDFFLNLKNWDSGHFLGIAKLGYSEKFQYAFFPVYPLIIKLISFITGNLLSAAILVSIVSTYFGLVYLQKLITLESLKISPLKVFFYLFIFPSSFYLLIPYSEGLFFFFSVATFYFAKLAAKKGQKVQRNLFFASIFAALSTATRITGMAVVLGLLIQMYVTGNLNKKNWLVIIAPLGIILYCIYLYLKLNNPFYFLIAEEHWQRSLSIPVLSIWQAFAYIFSHNFDDFSFRTIVDIFFAAFGIGLALRSFRFLPIYYSFFILVSLLIPLSTSTLTSFPRFVLPVFPIFFLLAKFKNRIFNFSYITMSVVLLIYFEFNFIKGYFG